MSDLENLLKNVVSPELTEAMRRIQRMVQIYHSAFVSLATSIQKALEPVMNILSDPVFIEKFREFASNVRRQQFLREHQWGLTPYLCSAGFYNQLDDDALLCLTPSELDKVFIDFFLQDNCYHLQSMVNSWFENPLFERRRDIFRSLLAISRAVMVQGGDDGATTLSYAIIPTLISALEGICRDFATDVGLIPPKNSGKFKRKPDDKEGVTFWGVFWHLPGGIFASVAWLELFENSLFASSQLDSVAIKQGRNDGSFNRHRIQHGNISNYGKPANLIRLFLALDFVSQYQNDPVYARYLGVEDRATAAPLVESGN